MPTLTLSAINIFPIKSLRGVSLTSSEIDNRGLLQDRRWMLVDNNGKFITQRQHARLALVDVKPGSGQLVLSAPDMVPLTIPLHPAFHENINVTVWHDSCDVWSLEAIYDEWFSDYLHTGCRLVYMPDHVKRSVDNNFSVSVHDQVGFADGFPFLLISEASLADLNKRIMEQGGSALPMMRFRPNLVVKNEVPYEEDQWKIITIGELTFHVVKPCSRCVIPTIDIETGEKRSEPMKTLSGYRQRDNKIYFGQNLIHEHNKPGSLQIGDEVTVVG